MFKKLTMDIFPNDNTSVERWQFSLLQMFSFVGTTETFKLRDKFQEFKKKHSGNNVIILVANQTHTSHSSKKMYTKVFPID